MGREREWDVRERERAFEKRWEDAKNAVVTCETCKCFLGDCSGSKEKERCSK